MSQDINSTIPQRTEGTRYSYLPWVDLICAGVPCQDVSVAGQRAGLAGARTGLFYEFARLLQELRPTWFLFENVPGLLSSNDGRDFAEVQRVLMVECGYGICWRILDSQFFGVAQRRRRLFIVGRFGKPCPPEVLFERESREGDTPQSAEAWADIANALTEGVGRVGSKGCDDGANIVVGPLGGSSRSGGFQPNAEQAADGHLVAIAFDSKSGGDFRPAISDKAHCTRQPRTAVAVAAPITASYAKQADSSDTNGGPPNLVLGRLPDNGHSGLLHAGKGPDDARETAFSLRSDPGGIGQGRNTTYAITENMRNRSQGPANYVCEASDPNGVRDFARLPKGLDSARYRALGNAVTVSVIEWIGRRIVGAAVRPVVGEISVEKSSKAPIHGSPQFDAKTRIFNMQALSFQIP